MNADILLVVMNFAGHDMGKYGREWIESKGGHFILLPSGHGVNQILYRLYEYFNRKMPVREK